MKASNSKPHIEPICSSKKSNQNKYRSRVHDSSVHEEVVGTSASVNLPRYFIIKRKDSLSFSCTSPFVIDKVISEKVGTVSMIKKIREGLLIQVNNDKQSRIIAALEKFHIYDVDVVPHPSLNSSKGVVTCRDLLNCSQEEILENLRSQNVTAVRKIRILRDGQLRDTASFILTFNSSTLPNKVKAGFYSLTVRPYIPPPIRCYRCQKYGHLSSRCDRQPVCECGSPVHEGTACPTEMICVNCSGNHSAKSRSCPTYLEELAIQKLKVLERLSYSEARKRVSPPKQMSLMSYAQATVNKDKELSINPDNIKTLATVLVSDLSRILTEKIESMCKLPSTTPVKVTSIPNEPLKLIPRPAEALCPSTLPESTKVKKKQMKTKDVPAQDVEMEIEPTADYIIRSMERPRSCDRSSVASSIKSPKNRSRTNSTSSDDKPPVKKRTTITPNIIQFSEIEYSRNLQSDSEENEEIFSTPEGTENSSKLCIGGKEIIKHTASTVKYRSEKGKT